jgi:hypothetical protein
VSVRDVIDFINLVPNVELSQLGVNELLTLGIGFSHFPMSELNTDLSLDFKQFSFTHIVQTSRSCPKLSDLLDRRFPNMLFSPLDFSAR